MKCERDLRKQIEKFFETSDAQSLHIHLNYQKESQHLNLVLYISSSLKEQFNSDKQLIIIVQLHRFSLVTLGIDHINVSYLHQFEQYFVEDLTFEGETESLLLIKEMDRLFNDLKIRESLNKLILETLKRFKFETDYTAVERELVESYFFECNKIAENKLFIEKCL